MNIPRIIIASPWSCSGKTTVATGLMGAFKRRGLRVQPFKVGPDFIDPSYHSAITGARSRNLDTWLTSKRAVLDSFGRVAAGADIAIVEGVMGLFDGMDGKSEATSTSEIAKLLKAPVILVLDVLNLARSAAALVLGCKIFDEDVKIRGVILNRVTGEKHAKWATDAIESKARVPVLGTLPYDESMKMPERHLGLIPTWEKGRLDGFFGGLIEKVDSCVDMGKILNIARGAPELPPARLARTKPRESRVEIGVALDEAFNFYYWDNIELLENQGARIEFFSPIHDKKLPEKIDGVYVGGGFPEVLAKKISNNRSMLKSVKKAIEGDIPFFAECGGLMYLMDSVVDFSGTKHKMVGLFEGNACMGGKLEALDYTLAEVVKDNPLSKKGMRIRGHEFHFSTIESLSGQAKFAYKMLRGKGIVGGRDGLLDHKCIASYMHLHFAQDLDLVKNFIDACESYSTS